MEPELLKTRIEAIQESAKRTRRALFIAAVVSATILVTIWNEYFGWDQIFFETTKAGMVGERVPDPRDPDMATRLAQVRQEQVARNFADNWTISISLLGIRVSGSDLSILGCWTLFFVSLYLTICSRRENHETGSLFSELRDAPAELRRRAYFGVRGAMVFLSVTGDDRAYDSLEPPPEKASSSPLLRLPLDSLVFLPAITSAAVLLSDVYFVFFYWVDGKRRWEQVAAARGDYQTWLVFLDAVGSVLFGMILYYNLRAHRYHKGVNRVFAAFARKFEEDFKVRVTDPAV